MRPLRLLVRDASFTVSAALILAVGIGAATAVFAVVRGVVFRPLDYPEPDRLVALCDRLPAVRDFCVVTPPDAAEWADRTRTLTTLGIGRDWGFRFRRGTDEVSVRGGLATPGLFETLGATTALGRGFAGDDQEPAPGRVVVLSHAFWRSRLGADPGVIGTDVMLDGANYRVIGVFAPEVVVPHLERVELWVPLPFSQRDEQNRGWRGFSAIGRLAPGVTLAAAEAELDRLEAEIAGRFPVSHQGAGVRVESLHDSVVGPARPMLLLFLGSVLLVLLVGCANLANLALARGLERQREFGLRLALGGSWGGLVRMLAGEQLRIAVLGGLFGLAVAGVLVRVFLAAAPSSIPRLDQVRVDGLVVLFTTVVVGVAGLLAGVLPAVRVARVDPATVLAGAGRVAGPASRNFRRALVIGQVALTTVLAVGAGLMGRSVGRLLAWEPGFDRDNLSVVFVLASREKVTESARLAEVFARASAGVASLPGVRQVATVSNGPLFGGEETGAFASARLDPNAADARIIARWFDASPGYFSTLGVAVVAGRDFGPDDRRETPEVAIVNETMARHLGPGGPVLGQRVVRIEDGTALEVVGVVRDVPPPDPGKAVAPEIYWPFAQSPRWAGFLVIRGSTTLAAITAQLAATAPEIEPPGRLIPFREAEARLLAAPRFNLSLSGGFAAVALILAMAGIYGVMSYGVVSRRREIGVRLAVGAWPARIRWMMVGESVRLAGIGILIGVSASLGLGRLIQSVLIGVVPSDPFTLAAAIVGLLAAATGAAWIPAARAGRTDPAGLLKAE